MQPVVTPFGFAFQHIMLPGIHFGFRDVRVHLKIPLAEEKALGRMVSVVKPLAPAVNHVMLPWGHAVLAVLGVKQLIACCKKIMLAVYKQAAEQIFGIKPDFHRNPKSPVRYMMNFAVRIAQCSGFYH